VRALGTWPTSSRWPGIRPDIGDIRRVVMVIKDGRVYDPAAIYGTLGIEPWCQE
jgi:hypothetical protein